MHNILDEQDLDPADRLIVEEQLEALTAPELSEEEQVARWSRVKALAPGVMEAGGRIVESIIAAGIRQQLGL